MYSAGKKCCRWYRGVVNFLKILSDFTIIFYVFVFAQAPSQFTPTPPIHFSVICDVTEPKPAVFTIISTHYSLNISTISKQISLLINNHDFVVQIVKLYNDACVIHSNIPNDISMHSSLNTTIILRYIARKGLCI